MNIRIQTYGMLAALSSRNSLSSAFYGQSSLTVPDGLAVDALKKGLVDLQDVCDVVAEEFWSKRQAFNAEQGIER